MGWSRKFRPWSGSEAAADDGEESRRKDRLVDFTVLDKAVT